MAGCAPCFTGGADREEQRRGRCPVIPQSEWGPPGQCAIPYMGGAGVHAEPDDDGCPGSWYRTAFIGSFQRYRRGQYGSTHLDRSQDRLVWDAVEYYESEQARHAETIT